jgi:major histocompatibility complex class I
VITKKESIILLFILQGHLKRILKESQTFYIKLLYKSNFISWAVMVHAFNPSTWEAEAGGFLSSRPAWSTKSVSGQSGLYRETLSQKNQ